MQKKQPKTSLEAYKSVSIEMLNTHYAKIIKTLQVLGTGTYQDISNYNGMESHAVARRLAELERLEIVWKPGAKKNTKSGRQAFIYQLTGQSQPKTETEVNYAKGDKTATDYANDLIRSAQNNGSKQTELFPAYQEALRNASI